jgi:hypothetical protein
VNTIDERVLRQRLHEEISLLKTGPVPADAVLRRATAIRGRRRLLTAGAVAALAFAVALPAIIAGGTPRTAPVPASSQPGSKNSWNLAHPGAPGRMFVSGVVSGKPWRLTAGNIAGQAPWCLPAVLLNGTDASLLGANPITGTPVGAPSFLTDVPGWPGTGFAFIQVPAGVTEVTATLPGGVRLGFTPVTVNLCGQRFHLAGFGFANPGLGIADISARFGSGRKATYHPALGLFGQGQGPRGVWVSPNGSAGNGASGILGSGSIGGTTWQVSMTLGGQGQCYNLSAGPASGPANVTYCGPIEAPPAGVSLQSLPLAAPARLNGYAGLVSSRTAYLIANLSDGTTRRLVPTDFAGRKYFALTAGGAVTLAGLTQYDAQGRPFGTRASISAVK